MALGDDDLDSAIDEVSIPAETRDTVKEQLSSELRNRRRIIRARWVLLALFIFAGAYTVGRLLWAQQHFRPVVVLDDQLHVTMDAEHYGISEEHILVNVNGADVDSIEDVRRAYDDGPDAEATLTFQLGEQQRIIRWIRTANPIDFDVVTGSSEGAYVQIHNSPAELSPEENIVSINDISVDELAADLDEIYKVESEGNFVVRMEVESASGEPHRYILFHYFSFSRYWNRVMVGFGFGVIGLVVFWLRPDTRAALGFLIFTLHVFMFWMIRGLPFQYRLPPESYAYYALQCFLPFAATVFVFSFTPLRLLDRGKKVGYGLTLMICIGLIVGNAIFFPSSAKYGILDYRLFAAWALCLLFILLISLPMDWWLSLWGWKLSPTDRQRSWVLRIALMCAFLPSAIYSSLSLYSVRVEEGAFLVELSVLLFPLLIGYSVVRYNLLQLNELVMESLMYLILLGGVILAYILGTTAMLPVLESLAPNDAPWPRPVLLAGILAIATPLHNWSRQKINERFRRTPFEFESFLLEAEAGEKEAATPFEYGNAILKQLVGRFRVEHTALFLRFPGQDVWTLSAITPMPETGQTSEDCSTLLAILEEDRKSVFRDELLDDIRYRFVQDEALKGMRAIHSSVIFPLVSRDRLIGALSLGEKALHQNYSRQELMLLKRIVNYMASTIFNLMGKMMALEGRRIADIYPNYPDKIGNYLIKGVLGEGGMSYVYLGAQRGEYFAVKVPSRMVQSSSKLLERFQREIQAVQRLDHENVVKAVKMGWEGPEPFIAFEYFPNGSLADELDQKGPLTEAEVLSTALQTTLGLNAAQVEGVIHRDIKPSNIFRDTDGTAKIADFGLAKMSDVSTLSMPGQIFGTPHYVAPEILQGESASIFSDQYSLGICMVELLLGEKPMKGEITEAVLNKHKESKDALLEEVGQNVSQDTAAILRRLLAERPEDRFRDYKELEKAMETAIESLGTSKN